ncbi:hypothetical protein B0H12DRAFT_1148442 [Mycena haematopus]|nr:hypothetical protein B0H12DRAFT_1148442 [Mycena haematopus]
MASPQPLHPNLLEKDLIHLDMLELPSPERRRVVRPQCDDPGVITPDHMWIIPSTQGSSYLPSAGFALMIRQEYHNLLAAVLWSLDRQSRVAQLKRDFPEPSLAHQMEDAEVREEISPDVNPNHPGLHIPDNLPDIFEETTFPNPFEHPRHGHFYRRGSALIITGLPGIGQTRFLSVIFYLRVAARLPTAYMRSRDVMLVYNGDRLFVLRKSYLVHLAVPMNAWILLDSNVDFSSPHQEVAECDRFIVQAASSRAGRTAWAEKIRGPRQFCLMKPWTLEELFAGSSLQPQICSGSDMHTFFDKFGGSARHVYEDSHDLPAFEALVDESARSLDSKIIHHAMTHTSPIVAVDALVGHMLFTALPIDDEDRQKFRLSSPTVYLEGKLLAKLNTSIEMARRKLYAITVGIAIPGCKATARDLLDKHHHAFIALGGKWRLREFTKVPAASSTSITNMWRASRDESDWVLQANRTMSVFREPHRQNRTVTEYTALTTVNFPLANETRLQKDHYYRPDANFPTFDSFYMDKKGHGSTFQASKGDSEPHTVTDGGREWLEARGITKFTYILVSGPKWTKFDYFFHLVLEYPDLKKYY